MFDFLKDVVSGFCLDSGAFKTKVSDIFIWVSAFSYFFSMYPDFLLNSIDFTFITRFFLQETHFLTSASVFLSVSGSQIQHEMMFLKNKR